ncbi:MULTISPECIES: site-specific DNA-methyltransferase [Rodentibacter]|uniref:site-specific DNA-methyltransferase n=1 Tax=Rodentibacter TaxID=1960084 RepID=UPI0035B4FD1E
MIDTSLYPATFQAQLLSLIDDLDNQTDGVIIHSDNFQALNLLQARYQEQVKCIYIDPPYNTEKDRSEGKFIYKDNYPHSTWLSLMYDRAIYARNLMKTIGVISFSIDEVEVSKSWEVFKEIFGEKNFATDFIWEKKKKPSFLHKNVGKLNDYIITFVKDYKKTFPFSVEMTTEGKKTPLNNSGNNLSTLKFPAYSVKFNIPNCIIEPQDMSEGSIKTELLNHVIIKNGSNENEFTLKGEFRYSQQKLNEIIANNEELYISKLPFRPNHIKSGGEIKKMKNIFSPNHYEMETNEDASKQIIDLFNKEEFKNPKPVKLVSYLIKSVTYEHKSDLILDYFAGSGTTAHAVINLNREDQGKRKYILVEQGEYFDTVLKPRIQKVVYAKDWKAGKPENPDNLNGISQLVKVLKLESYEDTLNNLVLKNAEGQKDWVNMPEEVRSDYLLNYLLEVESRGSLLNTDHFIDPFNYQLNIASDSAGAYQPQTIDLVETFNYLIGLKVHFVDDQREKRGWVLVKGEQLNGKKVLIIWRDCKRLNYAEISQLFDKLDINPNDNEFDLIYLNGDHSIASQTQTLATDGELVQSLNLRSIEETFLRLMFEE